MLTGELRNQIDRIWDAFWSGGIANPLEVIEQITYLLFLKRLDDLHTLEELKATRLKRADEHAKNNLPDILARWQERDGKERKRPRTAQSFSVPKADLVAQGYDLSLNRYKEVVHGAVEHQPPREILADLAKLEAEIQKGMKELEGMLS